MLLPKAMSGCSGARVHGAPPNGWAFSCQRMAPEDLGCDVSLATLMVIALVPVSLVVVMFVAGRSTLDNLKIFAVLMPLQAFATLEAGFTIPPVYVFLVLMVFGVVLRGESMTAHPPGSKWLLLYLGIAVVATVAAALWLELPAVQMDRWLRFRAGSMRSPLQLALTIFHFIPFFLVIAAAKTEQSANSVLKVHVWAGFILICLGLYQLTAFVADLPLKDFTWSINAVSDASIYSYGKVHKYGAGVTDFAIRATFVETRYFADYLLSVVPITLAFWISGSKEIRERFGILANPLVAILGVIAIFFTMSRSGWVALAVSTLILSLWLSPRVLFIHLPLTVAFTAFVVGILIEVGFFGESVTSFWSIIAERLDWQGIIMDPRVAYFLVLWEVVSENPILGVGAGNFGVLGSAMLGANVLISAHGVPWAALAEFGLLGFTALMVAFGAIMFSLGRSIRRCKIQSQRVVMIGLFASLTALLINTCTGADRPPFHLIFLLGMAATYSFFSRRMTETDGV